MRCCTPSGPWCGDSPNRRRIWCSSTSRGRIAKLLVQQAERQSDDPSRRLAVDLHLTQTELAQMVGASRPAVNRVLQGLVARGVIKVDGRTIEIVDAPALRRRAGL